MHIKAATRNLIYMLKFGNTFQCSVLKYRRLLLVVWFLWSTGEVPEHLQLKVDNFTGFRRLKILERLLRKKAKQDLQDGKGIVTLPFGCRRDLERCLDLGTWSVWCCTRRCRTVRDW